MYLLSFFLVDKVYCNESIEVTKSNVTSSFNKKSEKDLFLFFSVVHLEWFIQDPDPAMSSGTGSYPWYLIIFVIY